MNVVAHTGVRIYRELLKIHKTGVPNSLAYHTFSRKKREISK